MRSLCQHWALWSMQHAVSAGANAGTRADDQHSSSVSVDLLRALLLTRRQHTRLTCRRRLAAEHQRRQCAAGEGDQDQPLRAQAHAHISAAGLAGPPVPGLVLQLGFSNQTVLWLRVHMSARIFVRLGLIQMLAVTCAALCVLVTSWSKALAALAASCDGGAPQR